MQDEGRKKGLKVYELAVECGVTARELLQAAKELGLPLQNRLTRVDPPSVQRLRQHLAQPQNPPPDAATDEA